MNNNINKKNVWHKAPGEISRKGYLAMACGGTGCNSLEAMVAAYHRDDYPFPMITLLMDTDITYPPFIDVVIPIGIDAEKLQAIVADPAAYGPVTEAVVKHYPHYVKDGVAIESGSGTLRFLTQMCVEVHLSRILCQLKYAIRCLKKMGVRTIVPILLSSTGGGAGSALIVLLGMLFSDKYFVASITKGLNPHILEKPIAFVSEPFAFADMHHETQANRILGNAYAFRVETAYLEARHAFQMIFHQSLASDGGAVLDSPDEIYKGLGLAAYQFCQNAPYIKARFLDTVENAKLFGRYLGHDVPEALIPKESWPSFASELRTRNQHHFISLFGGDNSND